MHRVSDEITKVTSRADDNIANSTNTVAKSKDETLAAFDAYEVGQSVSQSVNQFILFIRVSLSVCLSVSRIRYLMERTSSTIAVVADSQTLHCSFEHEIEHALKCYKITSPLGIGMIAKLQTSTQVLIPDVTNRTSECFGVSNQYSDLLREYQGEYVLPANAHAEQLAYQADMIKELVNALQYC